VNLGMTVGVAVFVESSRARPGGFRAESRRLEVRRGDRWFVVLNFWFGCQIGKVGDVRWGTKAEVGAQKGPHKEQGWWGVLTSSHKARGNQEMPKLEASLFLHQNLSRQ